MDKTLVQFMQALRSADVPVSTSETIDAMRVLELVGYENKPQLKLAWGLSLPKDADAKARFDETFDRFFAFNRFDRQTASPSPSEPQQPSIPEESSAGTRADNPELFGRFRNFLGELSGRGGGGGSGEGQQGSGGQGGNGMPQSALGQMLLGGDRAGLALAMSQAAKQAGIERIRVMTQKGLYGRRIMLQMGLAELEDEMMRLENSGNPREQALGQRLREARSLLREEVKDFVGRQFVLHAQGEGRKLREDTMRQVKLQHLQEFHQVRELVRKMAKQLASRHARRRKLKDRGQLDVRTTLRKNIVHDGILFEPYWRTRRIDRPKVMAICDVSGSVSAVARFLLMFLYSLTEVLPQVRAFAFSGRLGEVTELFSEHELEDAIDLTMERFGMGSTDYGAALQDFASLALEDVDNKTTVIILGDARNNYGEPRADILKTLYQRARQVIWLNPEPRARWNAGDAIMAKYRPAVSLAEECNSLNHLERVVNRLLVRAS